MYGYTQYRQRGLRCNHAGQVCGSAGACDDHLQTAVCGGFGVVEEQVWGAVGGDYPGFVGYAEFFEHFGGVFHGGPVGFRAHDESYKRLHVQLSCDNWKAGHCMVCLLAMQLLVRERLTFIRCHFKLGDTAGIIKVIIDITHFQEL